MSLYVKIEATEEGLSFAPTDIETWVRYDDDGTCRHLLQTNRFSRGVDEQTGWMIFMDREKNVVRCRVVEDLVDATLSELPLRPGTIVLDDPLAMHNPLAARVRSFRRPGLQKLLETYQIDSICHRNPSRSFKNTASLSVLILNSDGKVHFSGNDGNGGAKRVWVRNASWTLVTMRRHGEVIRVLYTFRKAFGPLKESFHEHRVLPASVPQDYQRYY